MIGKSENVHRGINEGPASHLLQQSTVLHGTNGGHRRERCVREGLTTNDLFAFLTTEPNGIVAPVHQKAMPVILTEQEEVETWLTASWEEAGALQRPLPDTDLKNVTPPQLSATAPVQGSLL